MSKVLDNKVVYSKKLGSKLVLNKVKDGCKIGITGSKGQITKKLAFRDMHVVEDNRVFFASVQSMKSFYNIILGNVKGSLYNFYIELELHGIGFRVSYCKEGPLVDIGLTHYVGIKLPQGVYSIGNKNYMILYGVRKELVMSVANSIRLLKRWDVYKGKGFRYLGEQLKLKEGKQR